MRVEYVRFAMSRHGVLERAYAFGVQHMQDRLPPYRRTLRSPGRRSSCGRAQSKRANQPPGSSIARSALLGKRRLRAMAPPPAEDRKTGGTKVLGSARLSHATVRR